LKIQDKDLLSIQNVRDLLAKAKAAQVKLKEMSQCEIDRITKAMTEAAEKESVRLAKMAVEETGFGIWEDKVLKNLLGSRMVYDYMKDLKTVGIISEDKDKKTVDIAVPVGIVAALIPSTNPTSTTMFKILASIKGGNGVVISPHPSAKNCIIETARIMSDAAVKTGAPKGIIGCISMPSLQGTDELMKHKDTNLILATGGEAMVRAAYSSGTPAIGVGPGNGPAYIERNADIPLAVKRIFDSKTFDNGTICASEQSIVTEECIKDKVIEECKKQGAYFLSTEEADKLAKIIMRANGTMNPQIVGKSVEVIVNLAGLNVPKGRRVLIAHETRVGHNVPYSREKLAPILGFYVEKDWHAACERCIAVLQNEGAGHTMVIHSQNEEVIREFALKKPVSRLLVNTAGALGGVGATTGLIPTLTLGCGAIGGSATSDNVGPLNLINIRKLAYGVKELDDLRKASPKQKNVVNNDSIDEKNISLIVEEVLKYINKK
jgi:acetaldehyde dehydrogenase (acetylating)